jgi:putative ABC transport system permease protein
MRVIDDFRRDVRYTMLTLRKAPAFAAIAILSLALGIGVNTAVFSVVNAIIFRPLPVQDAGRLAVLATARSSSSTLGPLSYPDLQDYRAATRDVFDDIAGYSVGFVGLARSEKRPDRVLVTWVTGNYFPLLGVRPQIGRLIETEEGSAGRIDSVAVLGYSTWQRRFTGDPSVVGQKAMFNGRLCTIVGVVPAEFSGTFAFSEPEAYLPVNWTGRAGLDDRGARTLHTIARVRPGVTIARAQTALNVVAARLEHEFPDADRGTRIKVLPERLARPEEDNARSNAFGAVMMLALVGLVLLAAEVNVTNLLLARATSRRKELAVRTALGASRGRLIRQLFTESGMLAVLGGIAGVALGELTSRLLTRIRLPGDLPVRLDFHLDGLVLAYAAALTAVTALLVGSIAARRASRTNLDTDLRGYGAGSVSASGGHRIRKVLVVAQIAVSFMLLFSGALFVHSLAEAERANLGFKPEGVFNVQMDLSQVGYSEPEGRVFFEEVRRRVSRIGGVADLAFAFSVPMGYVRSSSRLDVEGFPVAPGERVVSGRNLVDAHYFSTLGVALEHGRSFTDADDETSPRVAIVNRRLAEMLWPGQNAIGRHFSQAGPEGPWLEVVGVTGNGKYRSLFEDPQPYYYVPLAQEYSALRVLHVRTRLAPGALVPAIEREIRSLEPELPLFDVQSMKKALDGGYGLFAVRTGALFAAILAFLGLSLAIVGLYGIVSYTTSERTHEFGVRLALGASRANIAVMVVHEGARLAVGGTIIGLIGAFAFAHLLARLLFGVAPIDPTSFALAFLCILTVTLFATYTPARRASRVDPIVTLRSE